MILSAGAHPLIVKKVGEGGLSAEAELSGFLRLHFFSPKKPELKINGKAISYKWSEKRHEGVATIVGSGKSNIEILI